MVASLPARKALISSISRWLSAVARSSLACRFTCWRRSPASCSVVLPPPPSSLACRRGAQDDLVARGGQVTRQDRRHHRGVAAGGDGRHGLAVDLDVGERHPAPGRHQPVMPQQRQRLRGDRAALEGVVPVPAEQRRMGDQRGHPTGKGERRGDDGDGKRVAQQHRADRHRGPAAAGFQRKPDTGPNWDCAPDQPDLCASAKRARRSSGRADRRLCAPIRVAGLIGLEAWPGTSRSLKSLGCRGEPPFDAAHIGRGTSCAWAR
jgi:hypothetical protein